MIRSKIGDTYLKQKQLICQSGLLEFLAMFMNVKQKIQNTSVHLHQQISKLTFTEYIL